jgi:hypothetical protein
MEWGLSKNNYFICFVSSSFNGATAPSGPGSPHFRGFAITLRHTTLGRTHLDEWSARCRDLYLTTRNTHKGKTSMPPPGFEPAIPASERPQTHALDRAATGSDFVSFSCLWILLVQVYVGVACKAIESNWSTEANSWIGQSYVSDKFRAEIASQRWSTCFRLSC